MNKVTTLQIRWSGDEDFVFVFRGHVGRNETLDSIKSFLRGSKSAEEWAELNAALGETFESAEEYLHDKDIAYLTFNHTQTEN